MQNFPVEKNDDFQLCSLVFQILKLLHTSNLETITWSHQQIPIFFWFTNESWILKHVRIDYSYVNSKVIPKYIIDGLKKI